jgi:RNA polymerase sigma factor (sigma-70 family)
MMLEMKDNELLRAYLTRGSEDAFRTLVERHLDMVFGVACRQLRDRQISEEVTQNTFSALARRSWLLLSHPNIAGWLYKAVSLEIRCRQRAESRKQARDIAAQEMELLMKDSNSSLAELIPFLDEGLLKLKDKERQALILRFLENKPLRQVGEVLGVSEDTAQKRVASALESLDKYFKLKGFKTSSVAIVAAVLEQATSAAPAGLAGAVMKAAFIPSMGILSTSVGSILLKYLCASRVQVVCAIHMRINKRT